MTPHGGARVDPLVADERAAVLKAASRDWPSWDLTARQLCDLELLMNGGFSPLRGFLGREDYESVCARMRLADGTLWPIPIALDLTEEAAGKLGPGSSLALRDSEGVMLAALHVRETWRPDRRAEALAVFGTEDPLHPGGAHLLERTGTVYLARAIEGMQVPRHHNCPTLRLRTRELRAEFSRLGWRRVIAFQ